MKIAITTADRFGFFVATYIMKEELLPVLLSINIRGNEKLKKNHDFSKFDTRKYVFGHRSTSGN